MQPTEYDYYSEKLTPEERKEYLDLCAISNMEIINDTLFNTAHDEFWKKVKERIDKEEAKK